MPHATHSPTLQRSSLAEGRGFSEPIPPQAVAAEALAAFSLSVVIPAYNEEERLPTALANVMAYLAKQPYASEVIVVDDGSSDATVAWMQTQLQRQQQGDLPAKPQLRLLQNGRNRGKGYSIQQGFLAAQQGYCLMFDADGATPIDQIERFLPPLLRQPNAFIIGSRRKGGAADTTVKMQAHRWLIGAIFNAITRVVVPCSGGSHGRSQPIEDTQCGFKLLPTATAQAFAGRQLEAGFALDLEYLHMAGENGVPIVEVPIHWEEQAGSKVDLIRDSWRMFCSVLAIRGRSWQKGYYRHLL